MNMPHWTRKVLVVVTILVVWQIAAEFAQTPLILPTFTDTFMGLLRTDK